MGIRVGDETTQADFQLGVGDTLILFTDGITEARRGKAFLESEGMVRLAVPASGRPLKEMADAILDGAKDFAGGKLQDDASAVLVRRA